MSLRKIDLSYNRIGAVGLRNLTKAQNEIRVRASFSFECSKLMCVIAASTAHGSSVPRQPHGQQRHPRVPAAQSRARVLCAAQPGAHGGCGAERRGSVAVAVAAAAARPVQLAGAGASSSAAAAGGAECGSECQCQSRGARRVGSRRAWRAIPNLARRLSLRPLASPSRRRCASFGLMRFDGH